MNKKIRPVNRLDKDTSGLVIFAKNEYIQENLINQMKPISRKEESIIEREVNFEKGQKAITYYKVIFEEGNLSLVNFKLKTGRTHQIRVHSKYINAPILGDTLYNKESNLINRQALHAFKIEFIHPVSKNKMSFETPIPKDIKNIFSNHNYFEVNK